MPRLVSVGRYEYARLVQSIRREIRARGLRAQALDIALDISCLTRVQLPFMVKALVDLRCKRVDLWYAEAKSYNMKGDRHSRLAKPSFLPIPVPFIVKRRWLANPVNRKALVLLGHEGQRTLCAWKRVDPVETFLLFPQSQNPEIMENCARQNSYLLKHLSRSEMIHNCDHLDLERARVEVGEVCSAVLDDGARISLIPYGPKPLLAGATLGLLASQKVDCDLMYCVPSSYNAEYSSGVERLHQWSVYPNEFPVERIDAAAAGY